MVKKFWQDRFYCIFFGLNVVFLTFACLTSGQVQLVYDLRWAFTHTHGLLGDCRHCGALFYIVTMCHGTYRSSRQNFHMLTATSEETYQNRPEFPLFLFPLTQTTWWVCSWHGKMLFFFFFLTLSLNTHITMHGLYSKQKWVWSFFIRIGIWHSRGRLCFTGS